jgi:hypothetical protein
MAPVIHLFSLAGPVAPSEVAGIGETEKSL